MTSYHGVAIMGATATGKSRVAIELARAFGGEIISMDSRQVYRGLDIGTAKVVPSRRGGITHHLIDVLDPGEFNSAGRHVARALDVAEEIAAAGSVPFFVGGTGFYFRALFEGLIRVRIPEADLAAIRGRLSGRPTATLYEELLRRDPARAGELSCNDRVRIMRSLEIHDYTGEPHSRLIKEQKRSHPWSGLRIVLTLPRAELRRRIAERTREMFNAGWVDEVKGLLSSGVSAEAPAMGSLGYGVIARAIISGGEPEACIDTVITQTQQYAKRQETLFRSVRGAQWVDVAATEPVAAIAGWIRSGDDFKSHLT